MKLRRPELFILLAGVLLRLSMTLSFDVRHGYDFPSHWAYVEYVARHGFVPPATMNAAAYYPPLYYFIAAGLAGLGLQPQAIGLFSALCGCVRLVLIQIGLERYLPESRLARVVGLAVAAFIPPALHLDGMVYGEALNNLLATAALLVAPRLFAAEPRERWRGSVGLGAILGLELLTKVSALALLAAFGLAAFVDAVRGRFASFLPWLSALALSLGLSAPYFIHNQREYGHALLTSFEANQHDYLAPLEGVSYFARRRPRFFVGWSTATYSFPYFPSSAESRSRATFFPVLIASTFVDYYNFGFCPPPRPGEPLIPANAQNGRPGVRPLAFELSIASLAGGTVVALATVVAWALSLIELVRRRDSGRLALLFAPMLALLGQLHFATRYPFDELGMIKGAYLQFAAPPLYALFGVAVAWAWARPRLRPLALLLLAAFALVVLYTIACRVLTPLSDL